jgi:HK97 family phage portal protein
MAILKFKNPFKSKRNYNQLSEVTAPKKEFNTANQLLWSGGINANTNLNESEKISAVYTCISILADTVSKLPISIKNYDGIVKDDLYKVLNYKPNSMQNRQVFYSTIVSHLYFAGNCYVKINRNNVGEVANLQILPINYFDKIKEVKGKLWYYNSKLDKVYRGEDLLHFKLLSKDGITGLSPIQALKLELNLNEKSKKTVDSFYSKNAQSTKVLEFVGNSGSNKKIDEAIEAFENKYAGYDNSGNAIVIPPSFNLKELKLSVEDAKFLQTAEFSEKSVAALFKVPVFMLGHSDSNYSTFEQQLLAFHNNTISSILSIITTELEFKLLSDAQIIQEYQIEFDTEKLAGVTLADKISYYKTLRDIGVLTPNQVAKKLGYEEVDNKYMNMHTMQSQYIFIEDYENSIALMKGIAFKVDENKEDINTK